jgi:hypothetical protein
VGPLVLPLVLLKNLQQCNLHVCHFTIFEPIMQKLLNLERFFPLKNNFKIKNNYKKFGITPSSATIVLGWVTLQKIEDTLTNNKGAH